MESLSVYILKSVIWLSVFSAVYYLLLRNERYFWLNRLYLIAGLMASLLFPLITIRYVITIPMPSGSAQFELPAITGVESISSTSFNWQILLLGLFISGVLFFVFRLVAQSFRIIRIIHQSENENIGNIKVIKTDAFPASFSFFSYVFVNPSTPEPAKREIVTHEAEHIRQHHWIDLILAEAICIIQWFNPLAWIYCHFIRQNHEYLADQMALRNTSDPAIYKAVLLNQLMGGEVVRLGHLFSYSLNKKRFTMMKNTTIPQSKKLKMLLIIPAMALVFYAFSKPEYHYSQNESNANLPTEPNVEINIDKKVKGIVVQEDGKPLPGTSILVVGSTTGSVSGKDGRFELSGIDSGAELSFSFVGYKTVKVPASAGTELKIVMVVDSKVKDDVVVVAYSTDQNSNQKSEVKTEKVIIKHNSANTDKQPLFILDGKEISSEEMTQIAPESIESINVIKDASVIQKYGEKAANGVVEIFSKKKQEPETIVPIKSKDEKPVFFVVEQMPQFPGGDEALMKYLATSIKYPVDAMENGIQGKVFISFVISETGKIEDLKVLRSVHPLLDLEAWRVVENMPDWIPGKQRNQNVRVRYTLPINFNLQKEAEKEQK